MYIQVCYIAVEIINFLHCFIVLGMMYLVYIYEVFLNQVLL